MNRTLKITAALLLAIGVNAASVAMAHDHATPETADSHVSGSDSPQDIAEGGTTVSPSHDGTEVEGTEDHGDASNSGQGNGGNGGASGEHDGAGDHSGQGSSGSHDGSKD